MNKTKKSKKPESAFKRWKKGEITNFEYRNIQAKNRGYEDENDYREQLALKRGFKNRREYEEFLAQQRDFKNLKELEDFRAQQKGFKNNIEYRDSLAQRKGFKNHSDYSKFKSHESGRQGIMSENKECASFLGVHIAERVLSKVFEDVQRMPLHNPGFDFICKKGYKIEVKSGCIRENNMWLFNIRRNKIADYFLLIAFENRKDLNPLHIWLIKGEEKIINKHRKLNSYLVIGIYNTDKSLKKFEEFELTDKLEKVKECCNSLKEK